MDLTIIRVTPLQMFILFLIYSSRHLENNYVKQDGIYRHSFKHGNIECHYFIDDLEVCLFSGSVMVKHKGEVKSISLKPVDPVGTMLYKYSHTNHGYKQKIRVYSNGIVIHTSAAFNFIYRLDPFRRRVL